LYHYAAASCTCVVFRVQVFFGPCKTLQHPLLAQKQHGVSKAAERAASEAALLTLIAEPEGRANSFVGTEEYLAPEIINGTGHGPSVDWFAFCHPALLQLLAAPCSV